jgi:hypothetical protein
MVEPSENQCTHITNNGKPEFLATRYRGGVVGFGCAGDLGADRSCLSRSYLGSPLMTAKGVYSINAQRMSPCGGKADSLCSLDDFRF